MGPLNTGVLGLLKERSQLLEPTYKGITVGAADYVTTLESLAGEVLAAGRADTAQPLIDGIGHWLAIRGFAAPLALPGTEQESLLSTTGHEPVQELRIVLKHKHAVARLAAGEGLWAPSSAPSSWRFLLEQAVRLHLELGTTPQRWKHTASNREMALAMRERFPVARPVPLANLWRDTRWMAGLVPDSWRRLTGGPFGNTIELCLPSERGTAGEQGIAAVRFDVHGTGGELFLPVGPTAGRVILAHLAGLWALSQPRFSSVDGELHDALVASLPTTLASVRNDMLRGRPQVAAPGFTPLLLPSGREITTVLAEVDRRTTHAPQQGQLRAGTRVMASFPEAQLFGRVTEHTPGCDPRDGDAAVWIPALSADESRHTHIAPHCLTELFLPRFTPEQPA